MADETPKDERGAGVDAEASALADSISRWLVPGTDADIAELYAQLSNTARESVFGFEAELVFVDVETTGVEPQKDRLIEIAALATRGTEVLGSFHTLVDPGVLVPPEITALTGIESSQLKGAPDPATAVRELASFVAGRDIVAHNVAFDRDFLLRVAEKNAFKGAWIDSVQLAQIALPRLRSHRLGDLAECFDAPRPNHRATDDVEALAYLWRIMLCAIDALPRAVSQKIAQMDPSVEWPLRSVISQVAFDQQAAHFDLKLERQRRALAYKAKALVDAEELECRAPSAEAVCAEFELEGLAGRTFECFEYRAEQVDMATAVLDAFASERHALIEAGTGVGKSLAYLIPAAHFAMLNGVGVGVATKTNSLLNQLIYNELPRLNRGLGEGFRFASLKGYDHYLCLRKLEIALASSREKTEQDLVRQAALIAWVVQSAAGDLDGINLHWPRAGRTEFAASLSECTRKNCRHFSGCYLHGARRRAFSAHIVVTNHALLFRDTAASGGILPPLRHWIIDEAHSVESEARRQFTFEASHAEVNGILTALHTSAGGGVLGGVRRKTRSGDPEDAVKILAELAVIEEKVRVGTEAAEMFFGLFKEVEAGSADTTYNRREIWLDEGFRAGERWRAISERGFALHKRLAEIVERGRFLIRLLEETEMSHTDAVADLAGLLMRLASQAQTLEMVLNADNDEYVYYMEFDHRRKVVAEKLCAALLNVADVLAENFLPSVRTAVFTSATLAIGDDFSHFAQKVGLDRGSGEKHTETQLKSGYDLEKQMAVFVPKDMPMPNEPGYLKALSELLYEVHVVMGGSVLTLFTNRKQMESLYQEVAPRLQAEGLPLLIQSRGASTKRLRDEFIADNRSSLFATKSFWEGFDAKGDTLRAVVVPKLPFARPDSPLAAERNRREGNISWRKYDLPDAVIELKQAAGRLIRSSTDIGCLVIADTRVLHKSYGRGFLSVLPVSEARVVSADKLAGEISDRFPQF
ncbi:MAG: DNA polymerase III subunit epsilon [Actinobacteria bacterium]|nr:DNA polymerase III subunit epsilon [Actinomycetota bacterium]